MAALFFSGLISLQLTQLWQHSPNGFSRSIRLLRRHRRRGVDGFGIDEPAPLKCTKKPNQLGDAGRRRIELSERRRALDQRNLGPPCSRELKLCLREACGTRESLFNPDGSLVVYEESFWHQLRGAGCR